MPESRPLRANDPREVAGYRLTARIGEGAQGTVYLGESDETGQRVAVKLLHADFGRDPRARTAFERELDAARRVAPFCTARILAATADDDPPHIITEYVDGPSLKDLVAERGTASPDEQVRLAIGTATALAAIHEAGVVHRDFKPANVLLGPDGPKVIDFGIARPLDATSATMTGAVGTPAYMAPEQVSGSSGGAPVDMFAWACTMVFAANGAPPFGGDTVPAIMQRVLYAEPDLGALTERLRDLVTACLAKDPADRLTATQVLQRLLGIGPDANLLAEGSSAATRPAGAVQTAEPSAGPTAPPPPPGPFAPPAAPAPPFGGGAAPRGPVGPPPGFPAPGTTRPAQGRSRRPLLVAGAAAAGVLLVAGALTTAILLNDGDDPGRKKPGDSESGKPVAQTTGAGGGKCSYPPSSSDQVKFVGTPPVNPVGLPTKATIKTNLGDLELELDPAAPCTVNSLAFLAKQGFYNRTSCHRLTTNPSLKVLQCGDPTGTGAGGASYTFENENTAPPYVRGTVAMANAVNGPNSSQFFILYGDAPDLAHSFPVFGHVTSGLDIIDRVAGKGTESGDDGPPKQKVTITAFTTSAA